MEKNPELISQMSQLHASAKKEVQKIKADLEKASQTEIFFEKYLNHIKRGWILHILDLIEKETPRLKKLREDEHPAIPYIEESFLIAKEESSRLFRRYPALLEEACKQAGLKLDSNNPHPKYSLEKGFFRLEIDESKRLAKLSNYEGRLAEISADIEAVVEVILREHERIFGRPYDGNKFLKQLRMQYKAVIKKESLKDGESVPIRHITRRLGKNKKGFRTDEFLIDLSRLTVKGPFDIDNRKLDLQQTKDTNQGMLLFGAEKRGYIGFIKFREV